MILGPGFMCGNGHGVKPGEAVPCPWCEIESLKGHVRRLERSNQALGESEHLLRMRLARMHEFTSLAGGYRA